MCERSLSVWFVCRLCRDSFGQVDAFIEHKKQKHFTQFQNTTSIVFEESEHGLLFPVASFTGDIHLADESNERQIKVEVNDEDPINPISSKISDEPNVGLFEVKSELITYERETKLDNENSFLGLKQPEPNPYVRLKRLTSKEIQSARVPQHNFRLLTFKQENLANSSEHSDVFDANSITIDHIKVKNKQSTEPEPSATVGNILTEDDLQFQCELCSKQLESEAQLKIHVGICALYHEDRNRFCVICNRKFYNTQKLKGHRVRYHGTEEEKLSLYKFRCHVCQKQYRESTLLRIHLESHKKNKEQVSSTISKSKRLNCPHPNCRKEFENYSKLQGHVTVHFEVKPFSCPFLNCNKTFTQGDHLASHFRTHNVQRPYKCTVDGCNRSFTTSSFRSRHLRQAH